MDTVGTERGDKEMWREAEAKSRRPCKDLKVTWRCAGAMQAGGDDSDPSEAGERRTPREGRVLLGATDWEPPANCLLCLCFFLGH